MRQRRERSRPAPPILGLGLWVLLFGCYANPVQRAQALIQDGRLDEAIEVLKRYEKEHPKDLGVNVVLGHAWHKKAMEMEPVPRTQPPEAYRTYLRRSLHYFQAAQQIKFDPNRYIEMSMVASKLDPP